MRRVYAVCCTTHAVSGCAWRVVRCTMLCGGAQLALLLCVRPRCHPALRALLCCCVDSFAVLVCMRPPAPMLLAVIRVLLCADFSGLVRTHSCPAACVPRVSRLALLCYVPALCSGVCLCCVVCRPLRVTVLRSVVVWPPQQLLPLFSLSCLFVIRIAMLLFGTMSLQRYSLLCSVLTITCFVCILCSSQDHALRMLTDGVCAGRVDHISSPMH